MTLTYGLNYPNSGRVVKRDLNAFLVAAKREFGLFSYFWVVEFQSRGAPHLHMATTLEAPDYLQRSRFAHIWTRLAFPDWSYQELHLTDWGSYEPGDVVNCRVLGYHVHSHVSAWERVRGEDGMSRYMAKYANKLRQKQVPESFQDIGRFWGTSRDVKLPESREFYGTDPEVRAVLAEHGRDVSSWPVLPKVVLV